MAVIAVPASRESATNIVLGRKGISALGWLAFVAAWLSERGHQDKTPDVPKYE